MEFLQQCPANTRVTFDQWSSFLEFSNTVKDDFKGYDEEGACECGCCYCVSVLRVHVIHEALIAGVLGPVALHVSLGRSMCFLSRHVKCFTAVRLCSPSVVLTSATLLFFLFSNYSCVDSVVEILFWRSVLSFFSSAGASRPVLLSEILPFETTPTHSSTCSIPSLILGLHVFVEIMMTSTK